MVQLGSGLPASAVQPTLGRATTDPMLARAATDPLPQSHSSDDEAVPTPALLKRLVSAPVRLETSKLAQTCDVHMLLESLHLAAEAGKGCQPSWEVPLTQPEADSLDEANSFPICNTTVSWAVDPTEVPPASTLQPGSADPTTTVSEQSCAEAPMHELQLQEIVTAFEQPTSSSALAGDMCKRHVAVPVMVMNKRVLKPVPALQRGAPGASSAALVETDLCAPGMIVRSWGSCTHAHWAVDGRKLKRKDKQVVSPVFMVTLPEVGPAPYRIMLNATSGTSERKKGGGFMEGNGHGHVVLKCESQLPKSCADIAFRVGVGRGDAIPVRGPVVRSFFEHSCHGLPEAEEDWDFAAGVDDSDNFLVTLEVAPKSEFLANLSIWWATDDRDSGPGSSS